MSCFTASLGLHRYGSTYSSMRDTIDDISQENQTLIQFTPERAPAFAIAEIALLVTLTSADRVVSATASHCLRLIAAAERQKGGAPTHLISDEEKGKRYPVYEQLGNAKALVLGTWTIHVWPTNILMSGL